MRRVVVVVLALLLPLLVPSAARAVGTGEPQILAPSDRQVVLQGYTGPVRIDFSDAVPDTYDIWVECPPGEGDGVPPDDYFLQQSYVYDGTDDLDEFEIPPLTTPTGQLCGVSVYASGNATGAQSAFEVFYVASAQLTIGSVTTYPRVFYPLVRDGFRDSTTMRYQVSKPAAVRGRVKDGRGRTIRYVNLGRVPRDGVWTWRGARDDGRRIARGRYTMEVTATDPELGTVQRASIPVRVATAVRSRHSLRTLSGDLLTGSSRSGSCSLTRDPPAGTATLDCTGAGYIQAWYRFGAQRSARDLRAQVVGRAGDPGAGTVTRQLQQTGPKTWRAGLRVTGVRSFIVEQVRLDWVWSKHL